MANNVARRSPGTGSISQTDDGRYKARFRYYSPRDGKTHNQTKICKTKTEANRFLKDCEKEFLQDSFVDVQKDSVGNFMMRWLEVCKQPDLKPTSYDRLEGIIRTHIIPRFGILQMGSLTGDAIQQHINDLVKEGKSLSTVKKVYDAYNASFKWGVVNRTL